MHEIAEFLRDLPPFDTLTEEELDEVVSAGEIEFAEADTTMLDQARDRPTWSGSCAVVRSS